MKSSIMKKITRKRKSVMVMYFGLEDNIFALV